MSHIQEVDWDKLMLCKWRNDALIPFALSRRLHYNPNLVTNF